MIRTLARTLAGTGLLAVAGVHLAWALGSSWPRSTRTELATMVTGSPQMPGTVPCLAVAAAAGVAAGIVASGSDAPLLRAGKWAVAGVLASRAAIGSKATRFVGLPEPDATFVRWDNRIYRPLCAGLAAASAISSSSTAG